MKTTLLSTTLIMLMGLLTTPCFAQWDNISLDISEPLYDVHFVNESTGFAVGWGADRGVIGRTTNGGESWEIESVPGTFIFSVDFTDELNGIVTGHEQSCVCALVLHTTDGGKTWNDDNTYQNSFGFYEVEFAEDGKTGYAGGYNGVILKTTDAGMSWSPTSTSTGDVFVELTVASPDTVYAVAGEGQSFFDPNQFYRTVDGGKSWQLLHQYNGVQTVLGLDFINSREGIMTALAAEGTSYTILKTMDAGETWRAVARSEDTQHRLSSVDMTRDGHGFIVGSASSTAWTIDGGETWHAENLSPEVDLIEVSIREDEVYVVGAPGVAIKRQAPTSGVREQGERLGTGASAVIRDMGDGIFSFALEEPTHASMAIFNLMGEVLHKEEYNEGMLLIDLNHLPSGLYFCQFTDDKGEEVISKFRIP